MTTSARLVALDERVDVDASADAAARHRVRVRGALGGDELVAAHAVAQLGAGEVAEQAEVELVPRALVRDRDVGRARARSRARSRTQEAEQGDDDARSR